MNQNISISIFSGGRGNKNLIKWLSSVENVTLNIIVNGYDDGLSTGRIRNLIPNLLGPSDFRKCASYVAQNAQLSSLFDYRLPLSFTRQEFYDLYHIFLNESNLNNNKIERNLNEIISYISTSDRSKLYKIFDLFYKFEANNFNYGDCAIGNIIFAGLFLLKKSFQETVDEYCNLLNIKKNVHIINIDNGLSLRLVALLADGTYLFDEGNIVNIDHKTKIVDFFWIPYTAENKIKEIIEKSNYNYSRKIQLLSSLSVKPALSQSSKEALLVSDIIVFGSGTQYSSLLPSYKILGYNNFKLPNTSLKVMIGNILFDHDILNLTHEQLIDQSLELLEDPNNSLESIDLYLMPKSHLNSKFIPEGISLSKCNYYKNISIIRNDSFLDKNFKSNPEIIWSYLRKLYLKK